MKNKIIFATGNEGKMKEIRLILKDLGREILSMEEAGFKGNIVESGTTFAENAEIKARAVWEQTGGTVLADDSGLVIDYLGGEPGVYSARYLETEPYSVKNRVLIQRLEGAEGEKRAARFVCNIAAVLPDGRVLHTQATMEGLIAREPAGEGGFGYDPILYLPEYGKTSAELAIDEKNKISHRGKALEMMKEALKAALEGNDEDINRK
ncbi:RdgB/HAM1 family non-canonical purine NTP pyrophosphatase [[Clostridium] symbiosum]|uniref:RdgB/HAM1 family non-canonical purine NTP pyrophosphatase n=1 Tax=Clostridium symbiosum TaxID=1512 RepID=UPI001D05E715|nr:RdgB/HAM1 family non-canonical purine NTP pyrophosphatase [[Clostridium] symbiosum]MCB6609501.1 RdgB/HAM1 family non-canonical purine NTP pyrophosphatase [[Clostridium] symbiosum]MCB6929506.1 RdgB/HAM1 family non-canonical purine NTP pyrophosphatase [[Clostridium] symbiosum]